MADLTKLQRELKETRDRLREAEETLQAIRCGEVDALVVDSTDGPRVYSLRSADHPYRSLVEQMHEGALTLSTAGETLYANQRFADLAGLPLEQVIGRHFAEFVSADSREQVERILHDLPSKCEGFLHATDRDVPVNFTASAMVIEEMRCVALVVTDLTDQKMREAIFDAEKLARMRLEEANRAKDEFLITVSHELRTPLTSILGWATLLRRHNLDAEMERLAYDAIDQSTRIQAALIDDLLDVSRIVTGKIRLSVETVDLDHLLEDCVTTVANLAAEKHIRFTKTVDDPLPAVRGDTTRLRQVFWNLLSNAIKFTPQGGTIELRAGRSGSTVAVDVRDSGRGISREFMPRIFDRFTQEEKSSTRQQSGLGVGLSVARDLVRMHGGTIVASSDGPGKGAVFTVHLPALTEENVASAADLLISIEQKPLKGLFILAVEDDPATRGWLVRTLEYFGAVVLPAASVEEAMATLDGRAADVVLSDLAMPVEDGLNLIRKLRVREDSRTTPAIALTAYGRPEDCQRILAAGFDRYLRKPIDTIDLVRTIHSVAKLGRSG